MFPPLMKEIAGRHGHELRARATEDRRARRLQSARRWTRRAERSAARASLAQAELT